MCEFSWAAAENEGREWAVLLSVLVGRRRYALKGYKILRSRWRSAGVDLLQEVVGLQSLGVRS